MTVTICLAIALGLLLASWTAAVVLFGGSSGRHHGRRVTR